MTTSLTSSLGGNLGGCFSRMGTWNGSDDERGMIVERGMVVERRLSCTGSFSLGYPVKGNIFL